MVACGRRETELSAYRSYHSERDRAMSYGLHGGGLEDRCMVACGGSHGLVFDLETETISFVEGMLESSTVFSEKLCLRTEKCSEEVPETW
ncbi:hypothetical protein L1887_17589 [Cichorium endivia]|nr:hypothetical protein L1887_17589 [Cichorium endivia]